ncbi:MAG: VanZ family protein [Rhodocyclaceae bacterium]
MTPLDTVRAPARGSRLGLAACLFAAFLVYLNLIPFEFRLLDPDVWMERARNMRWLRLSLRGRADWVANLFMFVPFGLLLAEALGRRAGAGVARFAAAALACVMVAVLAAAIEVLQILVPQRTVSLNDLLAAVLGGCLGVVLWLLSGDGLRRLWRTARHPSRRTLLAGLGLYALAYVALSPFPYDFVLGAGEFAHKLANGHYGLWLALPCASGARCGAQWLVEMLAVVPLGVLLVVSRGWPPGGRSALRAAAFGLVFGALVEALQFLTLSGISQGVSLLTRAAGFGIGAVCASVLMHADLVRMKFSLRTWALLAWVPYVLAVVVVTGLAGASWSGLDAALAQLGRINFLPFYYHYFTREQAAMASMLYTFALYGVVGGLCWPWHARGHSMAGRAAGLALVLACVIEAGKLFAVGLRPDPTNLLIAAVAAWSCVQVFAWLEEAAASLRRPAGLPNEARTPVAAAAETHGANAGESATRVRRTAGPEPALVAGMAEGVGAMQEDGAPLRPRGSTAAGVAERARSVISPPREAPPARVALAPVAPLALVLALLCAAAALWIVFNHPLWRPLLLVMALGVFGVVLRWPAAWLVLVPATLPVLDFRPWSGRLHVDEWDVLVLACLAALWLRRGLGGFATLRNAIPATGERATARWKQRFLSIYFVSYAVAVAVALWPPGWLPAEAWTTLHSQANAVRLAKGVAWAVLLWPFFDAAAGVRSRAFRLFALGMLAGVAATVACVAWERLLFTGLRDFSQAYRVTGMFSDTHTGGAFIEAYLVTAVPFLVAALAWRRRWLGGAVAAALFAAAIYAVAVTFARAGYAGLLVAVLVLFAALLWRFGGGLRARAALLAGGALVAVAGLGVAFAQVQGGAFMSGRVQVEQIERDWALRTAHWRAVLEPVLRDPSARWLGQGVGRFPEVMYWERVYAERQVPGLHRMQAQPPALVLLPGTPTYYWQALEVTPDRAYRLRLHAHAVDGPATVGVLLCEQWLIYSRRCSGTRAVLTDAGDGEAPVFEATLRSRPPISGRAWLARPVKFVLYHVGGSGQAVIEAVSLEDGGRPADGTFQVGGGRSLLANGGFESGLDRWFFASDDHLAWHIENMWVQVLFEQGVVGLVAWTLLIVATLAAALHGLGRGGPQAWQEGVVLAALLAFLSVGAMNSLFDAPRLATLFFLLVAMAGGLSGRDAVGRDAAGRDAAGVGRWP